MGELSGADSPGSVAGTGAVALPGPAEGGAGAGAGAIGFNPAPEFTADVDPGHVVLRLVGRMCYGTATVDVDRCQSIGVTAFIEEQLNPAALSDSACDARLAAYTTLTMTPEQLFRIDIRPASSFLRDQLIDATILRAVYSRRQLLERMVEFWTYHFNIDINHDFAIYLKTVDDREVIRRNALGKFGDLLRASAQSPAMLYYLDNALSTAGRPNENYAREVMELHTLGVDGGYTQQDVRELARCFTGWTTYGPDAANGALAGTFRFDPTIHDTGAKVVLGQAIPARPAAQGLQDGLDALNILLNHPATARNLARKLCRWFLGEGVPASVEDAVAAVYTASGGDIKAMLRAILKPEYLLDAKPKIKRPYHLVVSALRGLKINLTGTWGTGIRAQLASMGMQPLGWGTPDGYPDRDAYWSGMLYTRWNFAGLLAAGKIAGAVPDAAVIFNGATDAGMTMFWLAAALFGWEYPPIETTRIRVYLGTAPTPARQLEAVGLAVSGPTYQTF